MRVGAVVLHYNDPESVVDTVERLQTGSRAPDLVVVVDNNSTKGPPQIPEVLLVRSRINGGYAYGMNVGVDSLVAERPDLDAVLLLTQDTMLAPDALALMTQTLQEQRRPCVVGPLLLDRRASDSASIWSAGGVMSRTGRPLPIGYKDPLTSVHRTVAEVAWLDGAAMLLSMDTWLLVSGLDEGYFLYEEDVDLCTAVRHHGGVVLCDRRAQAAQSPGRRSVFSKFRNRYYYHCKWSSRWQGLIWLVDESARVLLRRPRFILDAIRGLHAGRRWWRQSEAIRADPIQPLPPQASAAVAARAESTHPRATLREC